MKTRKDKTTITISRLTNKFVRKNTFFLSERKKMQRLYK